MYAELNGTKLYYDRVGEGPPRLVMHGGLGLDHTYFRPWLDPLSAGAELIYYDHRANGRSHGPAATLTMEQLAADADALLGQLGHERAAVLGHSYGGYTALQLALSFPERVSHLVLCDTAAGAPDWEAALGRAATLGVPTEILDRVVQGFADEADARLARGHGAGVISRTPISTSAATSSPTFGSTSRPTRAAPSCSLPSRPGHGWTRSELRR